VIRLRRAFGGQEWRRAEDYELDLKMIWTRQSGLLDEVSSGHNASVLLLK
jgi:hypothetical protein